MKQLNSTLATVFAALVAAGSAQATTVNLTYNSGSLFNTTGISSFNVTGGDMQGVSVTACFSAGGCETRVWATIGASDSQNGGVLGNGWVLGLDGDSFSSGFVLSTTLTNSFLVNLSINGRSGLTAFDVSPNSADSPGSGLGQAFFLDTGPGAAVVGNIDVTYSDKLAVAGIFYDDLYTVMTLNFRGGTGFSRGQMRFFTDTDKTLNGAAIDPIPGNTVPTPATLALVGLGLLGLAANTRRKPRY